MADSDAEILRHATAAEASARRKALLAELDRKHGGPPPALTPEELDASEAEIHNWLRRGPPKPESDG